MTVPDYGPEGLDQAFLDFMGSTREGQRRIQQYYMQYFAGQGPVADLGCGEGAFVSLLVDAGIEVIGIDSDPVAIARGAESGLPVERGDAIAWIEGRAPGSLGGVLAAHLVEHLPYTATLRLVEAAYRALRPGGVIVLTTPDPRSLTTHLEMFWRHFGHVAMYHPQLLAFFLDHAGFGRTWTGHNPETASGMLEPFRPIPTLDVRVPRRAGWGPLAPLYRALRGGLIGLLRLDELSLQLSGNFDRLDRLLVQLDPPFEGYAIGYKGETTQPGG